MLTSRRPVHFYSFCAGQLMLFLSNGQLRDLVYLGIAALGIDQHLSPDDQAAIASRTRDLSVPGQQLLCARFAETIVTSLYPTLTVPSAAWVVLTDLVVPPGDTADVGPRATDASTVEPPWLVASTDRRPINHAEAPAWPRFAERITRHLRSAPIETDLNAATWAAIIEFHCTDAFGAATMSSAALGSLIATPDASSVLIRHVAFLWRRVFARLLRRSATRDVVAALLDVARRLSEPYEAATKEGASMDALPPLSALVPLVGMPQDVRAFERDVVSLFQFCFEIAVGGASAAHVCGGVDASQPSAIGLAMVPHEADAVDASRYHVLLDLSGAARPTPPHEWTCVWRAQHAWEALLVQTLLSGPAMPLRVPSVVRVSERAAHAAVFVDVVFMSIQSALRGQELTCSAVEEHLVRLFDATILTFKLESLRRHDAGKGTRRSSAKLTSPATKRVRWAGAAHGDDAEAALSSDSEASSSDEGSQGSSTSRSSPDSQSDSDADGSDVFEHGPSSPSASLSAVTPVKSGGRGRARGGRAGRGRGRGRGRGDRARAVQPAPFKLPARVPASPTASSRRE